MERENLSEAKQAWLLWQLLQELSDLLWNHYEEEFLDFVLEEDMDLYGESDKTHPTHDQGWYERGQSWSK